MGSDSATRTLAAIPAFNEEVAIGSVILRCSKYVDDVLVVDDGSEDRTADVAMMTKAILIQHRENLGKGAAIQSALRHARANSYAAMVLLDADGQHDPGHIPELLGPVVRNEADIVIGVRKRSTSRMPLYRRFGQRALDYLTAFGTKGHLTDSQSGYRALSRTAIESLDLEEKDFSIESEMIMEARDKKLRIAEVQIQARYDVDGSTKKPFSHGFGVVDRLLRLIAVRHPLLIFGALGAILFVAGIVLGLVALDTYKRAPELAIGYSFLVVTFLIIGGLSTFTGIMLNVLPPTIVRTLRTRGK